MKARRMLLSAATVLVLAACETASRPEGSGIEQEIAQARSRIVASPPCQMHGATRDVPSVKYPTITAALAAARPGDLVRVAPGTYRECPVLVDGVILKGLPGAALDGAGCDSATLGVVSGDATIVHGATVQGFTILSSPIAGVYLNGTRGVHVLDMKIAGPSSVIARGIWLNASTGAFLGGCQLDSPGGVSLHSGSSAVLWDLTLPGVRSSQSSFVLEQSRILGSPPRDSVIIFEGSQAVLVGNDIAGAPSGVVVNNGNNPNAQTWAPSKAWLLNNTIHDNGVNGLSVGGTGSEVRGVGNRYSGNGRGITVSGGGSYLGARDTIADSPGVGVFAYGISIACATADCSARMPVQEEAVIRLDEATVRGNLQGGLSACGSTLEVRNSTVTGNQGAGAQANSHCSWGGQDQGSAPTILSAHGTVLAGNDGWGVIASEDAQMLLGSLADPGRNSFVSNATGSIGNFTTNHVEARWNWFGTTDAAAIASSIAGDVTYEPFLEEGPFEAIMPPAPTAMPGNSEVAVSWPAVPGARSYDVHYTSTQPVTKQSPKVSVKGTSTTIGNLLNGTPYYVAFSAVSPRGETLLSDVGCAVPTAASTAGLTLHDPLCGQVLDGQKWQPPGSWDGRVVDGAAELSVDMVNEESQTIQGSFYSSQASVNGRGRRVTTLQADIEVPSDSASRTGDTQIRAYVQLAYIPPGKFLNFPGAYEDVLAIQIGLADTGSGLKAYRSVSHCDNASCSEVSIANIAFIDPPGFEDLGAGPLVGSPATYDTAYTVSARLDEVTGVFHWSIAGGEFGAGVSGTADPSVYLAANPDWSGVALAGPGFLVAHIGARTLDTSVGGGGSGRITGRFRHVQVGLDDAAATPFDDFSGTGGNSGPTELSVARWGPGGARSVALSDGSLVIHGQATSTGAMISSGQGLNLADPASVNTIQADVGVAAFDSTSGGTANAMVQGRFYSAGSAGAAPNSALGDVFASVFISPWSQQATYWVSVCQTPTCASLPAGIGGVIPGVSVSTGVYTLLVKWDPALHTFTFGANGNLVTVDPTATWVVAGPANAPMKRIFSSNFTPAVAGASSSMDVRVNNVFVAP